MHEIWGRRRARTGGSTVRGRSVLNGVAQRTSREEHDRNVHKRRAANAPKSNTRNDGRGKLCGRTQTGGSTEGGSSVRQLGRTQNEPRRTRPSLMKCSAGPHMERRGMCETGAGRETRVGYSSDPNERGRTHRGRALRTVGGAQPDRVAGGMERGRIWTEKVLAGPPTEYEGRWRAGPK